MGIQLGSAYGKVSLDASGVAKGTASAISNFQRLGQVGMQLGSTLQNLGRSMSLSLTLPILAAGAASIKYAASLEETKNKVSVLFGDMNSDILEWSKTSIDSVGLWQGAALDAAASMKMFGDAAGLGNKEATEFAKKNVELAGDLTSFFDALPGEAMTALAAAYRGENEPIRRFNVLINQSAVEQKALELGLMDSNGQLSQQARILAVNALIMEQTTAAQGDLARTMDSTTNQARKAQQQFIELAAQFGNNLLPVVNKVLHILNKVLEWFSNLSEPIQNAILVLLGFIAVLGPLLSALGTIISIVGGISTFVTALGGVGAIAAVVGPLLTTVVGVIFSVGAALLSTLGPILLVIGAIYLLYLAYKNNFLGIQTTITQLWFIIKHYFGLMRDWMIKAFTTIKWGDIGKNILWGIANGMLLGIPNLILAAAKAAQAVLKTFDKELDMHSPSKAMFKRGLWSGQGYINGLSQSANPNELARQLAKPTQGIMNSGDQRAYTIQMANGVTMRDVDRLMEDKLNRFAARLDRAMSGA